MEEKPKQTVGDVGHSLLKGALSGVPLAGGLASEIFNLIMAPPLTKRRDEWMISIAEGLKGLEEKIEGFKVEDLSKNESFVTTVMHATQAAIRNHSKEKLEALRNAVLNAALKNEPDEDMQMMFLNWIDDFTPWHLRILYFFDSPEKWLKLSEYEFSNIAEASPLDLFFHVFPELKDRPQYFELLLQDLADLKELLSEEKIRQKMQRPAYLRFSHTTNLGKLFLRFISSPLN